MVGSSLQTPVVPLHLIHSPLLGRTAPAHAPSVAGQSGTGRTTFVNTLCETEVLAHKEAVPAELAHQEDGIRMKPVTVGAC